MPYSSILSPEKGPSTNQSPTNAQSKTQLPTNCFFADFLCLLLDYFTNLKYHCFLPLNIPKRAVWGRGLREYLLKMKATSHIVVIAYYISPHIYFIQQFLT